MIFAMLALSFFLQSTSERTLTYQTNRITRTNFCEPRMLAGAVYRLLWSVSSIALLMAAKTRLSAS